MAGRKKKPAPKAVTATESKKTGRPRLELTDEQIEQIEKLAAVMTQEQIGDFLGMTDRTLRKRMAESGRVSSAYKKGRANGVGIAGSKLFDLVRRGNLGAICFYLKTQGGWRETATRTELTGAEGAPIEIAVTHRVVYPAQQAGVPVSEPVRRLRAG